MDKRHLCRECKWCNVVAEGERCVNCYVRELKGSVEKERMLRLGGLAILVNDGIISSGRARELGEMRADEQRAYLIDALGPGEESRSCGYCGDNIDGTPPPPENEMDACEPCVESMKGQG